jgi:hypothetical protein
MNGDHIMNPEVRKRRKAIASSQALLIIGYVLVMLVPVENGEFTA